MKKNKTAACLTNIFLSLTVLVWAAEVAAANPRPAVSVSADVKTTVTAKAATLPAAPTYRYNPAGKPDPFKPFIEQEIRTRKKLEAPGALPINPLQRAGMDQFRLVGISGDEQAKIAIVVDVKGKFYPLFVGTYIGLHGGRVVEILSDRVIIEEKTKTEDRAARTKRITMKLRKEGEEIP